MKQNPIPIHKSNVDDDDDDEFRITLDIPDAKVDQFLKKLLEVTDNLKKHSKRII